MSYQTRHHVGGVYRELSRFTTHHIRRCNEPGQRGREGTVVKFESARDYLALADYGDTALRDNEAALAVVVLVDADHRPLGDRDVLVDDRVLDHGVPADPGVMQDHRAVDLR